MNNYLKPIETFYKGYKFRSRLEARWAVFFDEMRFKWEYEAQGYSLSDGRPYLPDFKVNAVNGMTHWYEIKPSGESGDGKMEQFEKDFKAANPGDQKNYFSVLPGDPWDLIESGWTICPRCGVFSKEPYHHIKEWGQFQYQCFPCDYHTPCGGGNTPDLSGIISVIPHKGDLLIEEKDFLLFREIISYATQKARSARFEHTKK